MKNKLYFLGALASSSLIIGYLFKIMHWPGAGILISLSILLLILVFFPAALVSAYKANGRKRTSLYIVAAITLFLNFLAALFKIMHWEGASILLFIALLTPIVLFLPVYLYFHAQEKEESLSNFLYIMFFLVVLSGMNGFLAIDVSHELLTDITRINDATDLSHYYDAKSKQLSREVAGNPSEIILERSGSLLLSIQEIKHALVLATWDKNAVAIQDDREILNWKIPDKYSKDGVHLLLGETGKGEVLRKDIQSYCNFLLKLPGINKNHLLLQLNNLQELTAKRPNEESWLGFYSGAPLMLALLKMTEIENSVRLTELEVLAAVNEKPQMIGHADR